MKNVLAIVCLALFAVVAIWFAASDDGPTPVDDVEFDPIGDAPPRVVDIDLGPGDDRPVTRPVVPTEPEGVVAVEEPPPDVVPDEPTPGEPAEPRLTTVSVQPLGPDGNTLDADTITVHLTSGVTSTRVTCTNRDRETGLWTFERAPVGKAKVVVFGDLIAEHEETIDVSDEATAPIEIQVAAGAAIHYRATVAGEPPEKVTLTLLDDNGQATLARYQVRVPGAATSVQRKTTWTQGPEGDIFSVKPGSYRLRAKAPGGEEAEVDVILTAGETMEVELDLR